MKKLTYTKQDIIDEIRFTNNLSQEESKIMVQIVVDAFKK